MKNALSSACAAIAFVCAPAMAQEPAIGGDPAAGVGGAVISENPFTVANIDPAQPFGAVDVTMAGANAESMQAWADSLDADLKTEISQRCDVISSNSSSFPADAVGFCTTWTTVQANEGVVSPLPGASPNILPAPLPTTPNAGTPPPVSANPGAL